MGETKTKMKVRATLIEDMLGTFPGDPEIYKDYIASKSPSALTIDQEIEAIGQDQVYDKGVTVFARDKDGDPCVYDYLIKGFFKNACSAMREADDSESKKLKAYKKKIDNLVFVSPRMIKINFEGPKDKLPICERPLRASTPQGERVAISASESVPAGSTLEFEVEVLSKDMMKYVIEWLNYGKYNALGQWHNSGKGRITWEDITEE